MNDELRAVSGKQFVVWVEPVWSLPQEHTALVRTSLVYRGGRILTNVDDLSWSTVGDDPVEVVGFLVWLDPGRNALWIQVPMGDEKSTFVHRGTLVLASGHLPIRLDTWITPLPERAWASRI